MVDLEFGVPDLEFGDAGLLEKDPKRRRGNRCGETVRFSVSQGLTICHVLNIRRTLVIQT